MKTQYRALSIIKTINGNAMIGKVYDTYEEVIDHLKEYKEANGHSIHKSTEVSGPGVSIIYYRNFAIFTFDGIKDHFLFDMSFNVPIFMGKCYLYTSAYNFIDIYREFGSKCFDLLLPKNKTFGGNNDEA